MTAQAKRRPGQGRRPVKVAGGQTLPFDDSTPRGFFAACPHCGGMLRTLRERLGRACEVCMDAAVERLREARRERGVTP